MAIIKKFKIVIFIYCVSVNHIIQNTIIMIDSLQNVFRGVIRLIFFVLATAIAPIINKNSNNTCVMIHQNNQYLGMV